MTRINWDFSARIPDLIVFAGLWCGIIGCKPQIGNDKIPSGRETASTEVSERYLKESIDAKPAVIENYIILARLFLKENKNIQAKRTLETAYGLMPKHPEIIYLLSKHYLDEGQLQEAMAVLKKAQQVGVQSFGIFRNFARLYYTTGDFAMMAGYVSKVLQYDPDDWEMLFYRGEIARHENNPELAFSYYERVYELHPSDSVFNSMYDYAVSLNDMDRISRYVQSDFVRHPVSSGLFKRVGDHFQSRGMQDTTMILYSRAVEMDPSNPDYYVHLGEVYLAMGKLDSARATAESALAIDAAHTEALILRARIYDRSYAYSSARDVYERIIELDPENEIARKELGILNGKIAYLRDMERIQEQRKNLRAIKVPEAKKMKR